MEQKLTPQQMVIWTANAKPREQVFMLRLMDAYGTKNFTATIDEISKLTNTSTGTTIRSLNGLRDLGWLDSQRMYKKSGRNLPVVSNCEYIVTIGEKEGADST
jgi:predicted transcriptional regulator